MTRTLGDAEARLIGVFLEDALRVQGSLDGLLVDLEALIVAQDATALAARLERAADVLKNMESLEVNRGKIFAHLERATGLTIARDGLREIVRRTPTVNHDSLATQLSGLAAATKRVRRRANRCALLARQSIEFNQAILRGLFAIGAEAETYSHDGSKRRAAEMILDRSL